MTTRPPRIINRDLVVDAQPWALPTVDGEVLTGIGRDPIRPMTAGDLQSIQRAAYDEAFALGRKEGRESGAREIAATYQNKLQGLTSVLQQIGKPLAKLDEEMETALVDLVVLVARQLIRRELKTSQGEIVAVVKEAVANLPIASRHPRIHMNPEDIEIVRQALALGDAQEAYTIEEDPLVARGGCLIETETSFIDATVEARLNAVIAQMLGSQRDGGAGD